MCRLTALARPGMRSKLREALAGRIRRHHRFVLRLHRQQIDALDAAIAEIDREVDANLASFRTGVELLTSIPGISTLSAQVIIPEIGIDMSRIPDGRTSHLLGWPLSPQRRECWQTPIYSSPKGAPWLKTTLVQCAWSASRKKASYTQAQFHRLRARRGAKKAVCAVAASILTAAYHMLKDGTQYRDLGPDHFDRRSKQQQTKRLLKRLADLGFAAELHAERRAADHQIRRAPSPRDKDGDLPPKIPA